MPQEKEKPKEITVDSAANDVYFYLRKIPLTADEHDALRLRMDFLLSVAKKADELNAELQKLKGKKK